MWNPQSDADPVIGEAVESICRHEKEPFKKKTGPAGAGPVGGITTMR
jgi:hypothetical protein